MLCCPQCGSKLLYKDGLRYLADGSSVQRYLCRNCSYRFSETRKPYNGSATKSECDAHQKAAKLLVEAQKQTEKQEAGATEKAEIKGKIVEFLWHLRKEGYSKKTIEVYGKRLSQLAKSCNILDPEEVKEFIAERETWNNTTKLLTVEVYKAFTNFLGIPFKAPRYQQQVKIPLIPLEQEIDALIAGCSRKIATILQLLKETGMRIGEARSLEWTDIDLERGIITLNSPEKNSKPRMFKISARLVGMLNALSKTGKGPFKGNMVNLYRDFETQRRNIADKLQNSRIEKITFHTLRHWKATMEYAKTKDILYVMHLLGHKNIKNTLIYTQLVSFESDEYHFATATTIEEAGKLIQAGFEYVCHHNDVMLFRKRK
ncbi:MAG: tyrosine-type recombinase/integrase [Candidatus Bathyarchaeia archaeon]